ncbi:DUF389 domain-containing protein [Collinsella tanakaei]|uniref:TIGR00341 family protein n=1 Tax=Collinsella tanakaei YIT 12063 TaxID=742742 RepID=G1WJA3_9ACTN|nr:DUF389 domain-containing protein [Collinsella tanakaei]EGX70427.1 hypothetical protein HMPREF9452_01416 [Collinsella tanakaei YIT 12063]
MADQRSSQHNNRREDHHGERAGRSAAIDLQKYIDRHRRRHGERPALQRIWRSVATFFKHTFNIREGRAPYHVIRKRFVNGARLNGNHLCILIVAMVIACIGLDTNSDIAIVGAMLICPLMGSVLAIAYAAATLDRTLARDAAAGLIVQMVFCLITSTLYFNLSPVAGMTQAMADNSSPTVWDLILALVGGFAGGLGNSRDQEPATLISGVAVATALMPPLCAAGYGIAAMNLGLSLSALYEFGINVVFIALSAMLVLLLLGTPLKRDLNDDGVVTAQEDADARSRAHTVRWRILIGTAIFAIPCIILTSNMVRAADDPTPDSYGAAETARELAVVCPGFKEYTVGLQAEPASDGSSMDEELVARVFTDEELDSEDRTMAEELIRLDVKNLDRVEFRVE